jgi:hypothetical protein
MQHRAGLVQSRQLVLGTQAGGANDDRSGGLFVGHEAWQRQEQLRRLIEEVFNHHEHSFVRGLRRCRNLGLAARRRGGSQVSVTGMAENHLRPGMLALSEVSSEVV